MWMGKETNGTQPSVIPYPKSSVLQILTSSFNDSAFILHFKELK